MFCCNNGTNQLALLRNGIVHILRVAVEKYGNSAAVMVKFIFGALIQLSGTRNLLLMVKKASFRTICNTEGFWN